MPAVKTEWEGGAPPVKQPELRFLVTDAIVLETLLVCQPLSLSGQGPPSQVTALLFIVIIDNYRYTTIYM